MVPRPDEKSPLLLAHGDTDIKNEGEDSLASGGRSRIDNGEPDDEPSSSLWTHYNDLLDKNPLIVKGVTAFLILGLGDMGGQAVEHLRGTAAVNGVDWMRTIRFGMMGLVGAPWAHYYFSFLDYCFPPTTERPFSLTTWVKLLIDQGLQAPALLAIMISVLALFKGNGWDGVKSDMEAVYWKTLLANWKLWIPASLVNMAFVKPSLRVLYVNVVFFLWTIILSVMLNAPHD
mmetsp:Transcript_17393/g.47488  ORF Transcript_17393/g.47488 Transcript_17393/m.47488 type:complete len:231 (-) Transcript_17393:167-859(-)|eukprot:CAMPEP_0168743434 /NCGR_PEP_ID=MMETSP0724-20121128/13576_1 /TAXON_ID=265536 /ORGANISM="Amphiprora sp., Strain CCMP467" /LENGTH=230 /DNA_ID=CAMNT_0008791067 /DNA_START=125 /DNA_END=817 /DNA_ORIENTATION=-